MKDFKYPIYKQSKHSGIVIEFQNLNCGKVVFQGDSIFEVGYFGSHWENHTNLRWIDVTHLYQETVSDEKTSIPPLELCGTTRPKVSHYQGDGIEPIDYINSHNFNFNLGNAIKYISRCGKKEGESTEKDLKKAIDYLNFEIERIKNVEA